jgi:rod shape-determining protein MreB and related proteins
MSENIYLGIDLGTSRTSITASTGFRKTISSYVGYPKDHVAKKKLGGRDIIYGQEAVENRLSLNLYRPLAKSNIKQDDGSDSPDVKKAIKDLLEHAIAEVNAPAEATIFAVIGSPATTSVAGKATLLEAAADCTDSVIVCSEPFAVAYGLDFFDEALVIDIGAGTTDLCRVHGTLPTDEDQRTLTAAGDSIDEMLSQLILEKHPDAQFTVHMIRAIKERHASVSSRMDEVEEILPVGGRPTKFNLTDQIYKACYSIVPQIVASLQDLIATSDPEFQAKLRHKILLAGGGSQIRGMGRAIEKALSDYGGGKVSQVDDPQFAAANGALKIALDMPLDYWAEFRTNRDLAVQGMSGLVS